VRWRIHGVCQNAENFADSNVSGEDFTKTRLAAVLASEGFSLCSPVFPRVLCVRSFDFAFDLSAFSALPSVLCVKS
jgi:hypothetical protein